MNKDDLLKHIAETGYNVGFGAKKHFATYDIVNKVPGFINFFSLAFGIYALVFKELAADVLSATFLVLGIVGLYISVYEEKKDAYEKAGSSLTKTYNELCRLYNKTKSAQVQDISALLIELKSLETSYYSESISKQILFSDWYAHYKFFWQHQIDWVNEQKKFKFLRDKLPLSFMLTIVVIVAALVVWKVNIITLACEFAQRS